jgi:sporadic carbohydrate cluster protein (TIGR04323 family)
MSTTMTENEIPGTAGKCVEQGDASSHHDEALEQSLRTAWDAKLVEYDRNRFPFDRWILSRIRTAGYELTDLTEIHREIPLGDVYKLTKQLCADTNLPEFRRMLNRFVREVVVVKGDLKMPVGVQRYLNVRVMLPNRPETIFPFHTGLLYGHGIASRSLWMPLTDVSAPENYTASMQIIDIAKSRELVRYAIDNRLTVDQMTEMFGRESWPLRAKPGLVCFFTQENIHGNFVNVTGKTRVSIDFRVAEEQYGDLLARKIPAGYFHLIPESEEREEALAREDTEPARLDNGKINLHYINNNTSSTFGVPVHLQRYMILDYCTKRNLNYEFELFELEDMVHVPTLSHVIRTLKCNLIMYSIFALPEDDKPRNDLLEEAVKNGLIIHFVNEGLVLSSAKDLELINRYLKFSKFGHSRMPIGLPLSNHSKQMFGRWIAG